MIFANRQYGSLALAHQVGPIGWDELLGQLRVLCINSVFAEYWDRTVERRWSLRQDAVEAKIGAAVHRMTEELAEEPDEWWVVGSVPEPKPEPPAHG
ncbi:DUF6082 family protein [Streptomyces sp. NPDC001492]